MNSSGENAAREQMTYAEYRARYSTLSDRQKRWLAGKAQWEAMTMWAVLNEWSPPDNLKLTPCGAGACYGCDICKSELPFAAKGETE